MRLVFPLLLILLAILIIGFLITNPDERVTVALGNTQYRDVHVSLVTLCALAVGVAFTAVVALVEGAGIRLANRTLRREVQRLETELDFLRRQPPAAPAREPDALDDDVSTRRTSAFEAEDDDEPLMLPDAPVYTPEDTD